jgi:hypothetical protein
MVEEVRCWPLTAKARVCAWVIGLMVDKLALTQDLLRFYSVNIIPPWFSMLIYHLESEQQAR